MIPLLDLHAQFKTVERDVRAAIDRVLASQVFILGPEVEAMEKSLAAYTECAHAIGVSSGTDALLLSMMALGIGPGDEVITTPYTFFATVGCIVRLGARPIFVDIDPKTFNLDVSQVASKITPRTKALVPVHLFGQCADMAPLLDLAHARNIPIIEDAAQALGARYQGRAAGSMGRVGCYSFFPSKNLGTLGDGGLITTQDAALAEKLRMLRAHGSKPKYYHRLVGGNFRIDALHAAVVAAKLPHLDDWHAARQAHAQTYTTLFQDLVARDPGFTLPWVRPGDRHIFNQYVIQSPKRDAIKQRLTEHKIGCEIYYPVPMHLQECFANLGYREGDFPHAERAAKESLAIPVFPELTQAQQEEVVSVIASV